jgi:methanethiol oxidase
VRRLLLALVDGLRASKVRIDADVESGGMALDERFFPNDDGFPDLRVHQTRLQGGDASSDSYSCVD